MNTKYAKKVRKLTMRVMKRDFTQMMTEAMGMSFWLRLKMALKILCGR